MESARKKISKITKGELDRRGHDGSLKHDQWLKRVNLCRKKLGNKVKIIYRSIHLQYLHIKTRIIHSCELFTVDLVSHAELGVT